MDVNTYTSDDAISSTTTMRKINTNDGFLNNESSIYIGSSGILTIIVVILITYICYKKKRQTTALVNVKSNSQGCSQERNPVHWKKHEKNNSENIYDEIDESLLCDITIPSNEGNNLDDTEDEENSYSINEELNEGYLNPYQPIISTEVDVHQYNTTKNEEDNSLPSEENLRDSGYLHPYQPLVASCTNTKHEYTGIEHLDIDTKEIQNKEDTKTVNDRQMCFEG